MAQVVNLNPLCSSYTCLPESHPRIVSSKATLYRNGNQSWTSVLQQVKCNDRFSCLFSDNRREEQARKALESALGGKKNEFEKWNNEIKMREEAGGSGHGGTGGGGGWFGWGRWFGWFDGDNFWQEAQQASLALLGIIIMYLIIAKGEVMLALVFNPLLYALRGARNGITSITSRILRKTSFNNHANFDDLSKKEGYIHVSAKESVLKKWGRD